MPSVLFVCTGNICRSPMAEALFRQIVSQRSDAVEWRIESAGTWAVSGYPSDRLARRALARRGLYERTHRSRTVSAELLRDFDLILVMEAGHKEALRLEFPQVAGRVYLLTEMVDRRDDVADPIGGSDADFEDTARELEQLFERGMGRILELAGENLMNRQTGEPGVGRMPVNPFILVIGVALIHGLLYTFLVPPWQHYDEPNHFEVAWLIANRGRLPQTDDYDPDMRRAVAASMIEHNFFRGMNFLPDLEAVDGKVWIGQYSQLGDPPLHYLLAALPLWAFRDADVTTQLILARLVSLVLYLVTIAASWAIMGELVAPQNPLRWLVPLTMAMIPSFADLMTSVNNDVSATAIFTLFLWGSVRLLRSLGLLNLAWVIGAALLCLLTKPSVYVALPLLLLVLLLALLRGRWRWLGWSLLGVGGVAALTLLFWSPTTSAFWDAESNQGQLSRQAAANAPLGGYVWMVESVPGLAASKSARFRQLLASKELAALAGQEVTLGVWMWASQPVLTASPQVYIQGSTTLDASELWPLAVQPTFHAFTFTVPQGVYRGWINLAALTDARNAVQVYADGLVLAAGAYPLDQPPIFDDDDGETGLWGGNLFQNMLRNPSAEHAWPGINPQLNALSARLLPDQGRLSLMAYTLFDWPGGGAYYRATAVNLFKTFWAKFGWGHVPLAVNGIYRLLALVTLVGLIGAAGTLVKHDRRLPYAALACLGLSLGLIWGNAVVRGAIYVFQVNPFIPSARYTFPAMLPTVLVLAAGWLVVARLLQRSLRLPGWLLTAIYLLAFGALDVLALVSIVQFYT